MNLKRISRQLAMKHWSSLALSLIWGMSSLEAGTCHRLLRALTEEERGQLKAGVERFVFDQLSLAWSDEQIDETLRSLEGADNQKVRDFLREAPPRKPRTSKGITSRSDTQLIQELNFFVAGLVGLSARFMERHRRLKTPVELRDQAWEQAVKDHLLPAEIDPTEATLPRQWRLIRLLKIVHIVFEDWEGGCQSLRMHQCLEDSPEVMARLREHWRSSP